ncbi:hypothetical protein MCBG_05505 [Micromonospora sp. M42]|uniref:hypothetical protein n=1 Tax=Micromonospora sp. M42 TaxID=457406 RepID=UPI0003EEC92F|nr:hypothetical protein [Micromonospora sp. M42]EWM68371.1 hypothetical protein MCBG_05505 [Micromonospora sp. M42]
MALVSALVFLSDVLYEAGPLRRVRAGGRGRGERGAPGSASGRSIGAYLLSKRAEALIALGRWDEA